MFRRLVWLLPVLIVFWNLGYAPFWNPDEGRYAAAAYEMAHPFAGVSDWLVPHLNTVPRLNKPPLIYWGVASAFRAFGVSEWSARLVPALASLLVLVLLFIWGTKVWNERVGLAAGLVWSTVVASVAMGRVANTDMLLCASVTLTMFGIFWAIEGSAKRLQAGALAGVGLGLALLSKGPVGVALPLLFAFVYLCLTWNWKRAPWGALALALGVGLLIGAPWFLAVEARQPGFLHTFIFAENLGRFSGQEDFHKSTSPFYYVPVVILGLLPWTGFLVPVLARWREPGDLPMRAKIFAAVWALVLLGFFSFSGTKLISYALPALPALALLLGATVGRWEEVGRIWQRAAIAVTLFFNGALLLALWAAPHHDKVTKNWTFAGVLIDDVIVPRTVGLPRTLALSALLLLTSMAWLWTLRPKTGAGLLAWGGASAALLAATLLGVAGTVSAYEDAGRMLATLRPQLRPGDRIATYRAFVPGATPYVRRPVMYLTFQNSSGLYQSDLARSPFYSTLRGDGGDAALETWLRPPGRAFVITEGLRTPQLARGLYLWGRTNDFFLLSNQPKPAAFGANLTFASPRRSLKNRLILRPKNVRK